MSRLPASLFTRVTLYKSKVIELPLSTILLNNVEPSLKEITEEVTQALFKMQEGLLEAPHRPSSRAASSSGTASFLI